MSRGRTTTWMIAGALWAFSAVVAACSVNPQPLPPGGDDDTPLPTEVGRGNDTDNSTTGSGGEAAPPQAPSDAGGGGDGGATDGGDGGDAGDDAGDGG